MTHGTDRSLWALRIPTLEPGDVKVATQWLDKISVETKAIEQDVGQRDVRSILTLKKDTSTEWVKDAKWDELMRLRTILPGEE